MIDDSHPRAINRRAWGPAPPRENDGGNDRHRLQIAAVEKLHLAVDNQTLCSLVTVDELDVYPDEAALRAWNDGPLEQCAECQAALLAPIRPSAPAVLGADRRANRTPRAGRARPADPRAESLMERDKRSIDDQVLAALRAPTLSGMSAVMNPKLIGHHIALTAGTGWGPSPQRSPPRSSDYTRRGACNAPAGHAPAGR